MKKVSKAILIALAALLALAVIVLFGANLYLQSPSSQARIQEELSKALRVPLEITNTSVTPWSDLRVSGITVPNEGANFLEAASFNARYRFLPLFRGRLEISEMSVESPKMVWRQNAEGKWKMPRREKAAAPAPEKTASSEPKAEPEPETSPESPAPQIAKAERPKEPRKEKAEGEKKPERGFTVVVDHFHIRNGSLELLDKEGRRVATFSEVNIDYTTLTEERVEGVATIGRAVWADTVTLEKVRSPFLYTQEEFSLPELTATVGGGPLTGRYRSQKEESKNPFEAAVAFEAVDLGQLVAQGGGQPGQAAGKLTGKLDLRGDTGRPERAEGTGRLDLREGQLRQLELFQTIGQVLAIRELADFRLKDAHADIRVGSEKVYVDQLVLPAQNLRLSGKGNVRFDQKVALEAQLAVDEALLKQLPSIVRDSFGTAEDGRKTIDFNITGTTAKLKTNILDKLIGQKVTAQFDDLLSGIFGGKKKEDEKKKKEEEERKKAEKEKEKERRKREKAEKAAGTPPAPASGDAPQTSITPARQP